jgi:hypothetical protein
VEDDERSGRARSHRTDENVGQIQNLMHSDRRLSINQDYYVEILKLLHEAVGRRGLNLDPTTRFSTIIMLQLTRRSLSSSFWPKN